SPPMDGYQREPGCVTDWPSRSCTIHGLFERHAQSIPDSPALLRAGCQLTYAQLNKQANPLANHLASRDARRGVLVVLDLERCTDVIVGLLGILKAGGAYVPLDPAYPDERLAYMLRDTAARYVIAHQATASRLAFTEGMTSVLSLDALASEIGSESNLEP